MTPHVKEIIPWGRTFDEYRLIFDLSPRDLTGRILGCGDGPASFNAEATAMGHAIISCDPIYRLSAAAIESRVKDCYDDVIAQLHANQDGFVWTDFRDPDELGRHRLRALHRFLADVDAGRSAGRYITAALPYLPFPSGQFDLALVSHLLFLYSDHLSFQFHLWSIDEMLRVAREVRIFPLLTLGRQVSPYLEGIRTHVTDAGFTSEIRHVAYEFQRGANQMLVLTR